eukprot:CAMPEP_0113682616 /NCGR_PEP_ID=MMETSP0038_2-20120614/12779_1 /TAXON_ID=2898 /ORGANISM="Cryptomonas paramecium" /LENGTH=490 /DNA_ID=CAMNT_0000601739 /DNA_START=269 /DNA_END=1741 /DNA_ORIENTATION=- /assembly_acc=CAM_ASM_000170
MGNIVTIRKGSEPRARVWADRAKAIADRPAFEAWLAKGRQNCISEITWSLHRELIELMSESPSMAVELGFPDKWVFVSREENEKIFLGVAWRTGHLTAASYRLLPEGSVDNEVWFEGRSCSIPTRRSTGVWMWSSSLQNLKDPRLMKITWRHLSMIYKTSRVHVNYAFWLRRFPLQYTMDVYIRGWMFQEVGWQNWQEIAELNALSDLALLDRFAQLMVAYGCVINKQPLVMVECLTSQRSVLISDTHLDLRFGFNSTFRVRAGDRLVSAGLRARLCAVVAELQALSPRGDVQLWACVKHYVSDADYFIASGKWSSSFLRYELENRLPPMLHGQPLMDARTWPRGALVCGSCRHEGTANLANSNVELCFPGADGAACLAVLDDEGARYGELGVEWGRTVRAALCGYPVTVTATADRITPKTAAAARRFVAKLEEVVVGWWAGGAVVCCSMPAASIEGLGGVVPRERRRNSGPLSAGGGEEQALVEISETN